MTPSSIQTYHAHLYYEDQAGVELAKQLVKQLQELFPIQVGRFHEKKVGPHPMWSVQITFSAELFSQVIPWLMVNRQEIDVFFHPVTGDELFDHSQGVAWLGNAHSLNIDQFLPKI